MPTYFARNQEARLENWASVSEAGSYPSCSRAGGNEDPACRHVEEEPAVGPVVEPPSSPAAAGYYWQSNYEERVSVSAKWAQDSYTLVFALTPIIALGHEHQSAADEGEAGPDRTTVTT
jgi:hypothetical protein